MAELEAQTLVRTTDPQTSHDAAEAVVANLTELRLAVLELVWLYGPSSSSRINRLYAAHRHTRGWPHAAPDSPRKRAGWLADPARLLLEVSGRAPGPNGVGESVYKITEKGRTYLQERAS